MVEQGGGERNGGHGSPPLLEVRDLRTSFVSDGRLVKVVDGVGFELRAGETLCLVGESGCGKSVTALSIMRLVAPGARLEGAIRFDGTDLLALAEPEMRRIRGRAVSMIFQEPMTSLNPAFPVGEQIVEVIQRHHPQPRKAAVERAVEMLRRVRIPAPDRRFNDYPHQLSGGMRQRVMIALALVNEPRILIADEPTTALDVTIQAQILELIRELQSETGTAVVMITHDLGVVAEVAHHVAVMYAGRIVERAPVQRLFEDPQHPYTLGLLSCLPRLDRDHSRLVPIAGAVPSSRNMPVGCRFSPRCPFADARCKAEAPPLRGHGGGHDVACWHAPIEEAARVA